MHNEAMTRRLQRGSRSLRKRMIAFCVAVVALVAAAPAVPVRAQTSEIRPEDELVVAPRPMTALELRLRALHPNYYDPERPEYISRPPHEFWVERLVAIERSDAEQDALADVQRDVVGFLANGTRGWRIVYVPGVECAEQEDLRNLVVFTFWAGDHLTHPQWRAVHAFRSYAEVYNSNVLSRSLQPPGCEGP